MSDPKKKVNWEKNEDVPDWVPNESAKQRAKDRAKQKFEAAKKKQEAKAKGDEWGKKQVDRQKRREEILAGRPRDSKRDKDTAETVAWMKDYKDFAGPISDEKINQYLQQEIPDASADLSEGSIEDELKFNPGSKDEMTAKKSRAKEGIWSENKRYYKKGGWIKNAIKKPGALRQSLGVKKGEKIPAKKLATAAKKPGKMGQRARLAETLKGFNGGGSTSISRGDGCAQRGKTRGKYV